MAAIPLMFSISALFNIYPTWLQDWMQGIGSTAMVALMAAVPLALVSKWVPWPLKIPIVPFGAFLCYLLIQGAGEQISASRDAIANGAQAKIHRFDELKKIIGEKETEKEGYGKALDWRVGSEENVKAAQRTFDTAAEHKEAACKAYPYGQTCKDAKTAETAAQGKLTDATNDQTIGSGRRGRNGLRSKSLSFRKSRES